MVWWESCATPGGGHREEQGWLKVDRRGRKLEREARSGEVREAQSGEVREAEEVEGCPRARMPAALIGMDTPLARRPQART
jgi:hypothetical protein